jgi:hypothetical protein
MVLNRIDDLAAVKKASVSKIAAHAGQRAARRARRQLVNSDGSVFHWRPNTNRAMNFPDPNRAVESLQFLLGVGCQLQQRGLKALLPLGIPGRGSSMIDLSPHRRRYHHRQPQKVADRETEHGRLLTFAVVAKW